jgi:nickel superoxide dismutase
LFFAKKLSFLQLQYLDIVIMLCYNTKRKVIKGDTMLRKLLIKILPITDVHAHCDLPCGVYDPAQARIEAQSVYKIMDKYNSLSEEDKTRAILIKEQRAELVKHHLWVLWTDYFKPEHLEKFSNLHDLFWQATKQAGLCKKSIAPAEGQKLLDLIDEVSDIFDKSKN